MTIFDSALVKRFTDSTEAVTVTSLDTLLVYDNETGLIYKVPVSVLTEAVSTIGIPSATHAATSKVTPIDADEIPLVDSASSFSLKKLTWANLKATLAAWMQSAAIAVKFTTISSTLGLVIEKTSGIGIKVDTDTPTYGWRDLIGDITPKTSDAGSPTLSNITGNIRGFGYNTGDDGDTIYHVPHDYLPGSDLYIHPHWTHNGTNISGSLVINLYLSYAKGHQQASFSTQVTATVTDGSLTIANTPALWHRIPEIQISTPGGSASKLNTTDIEVDGLILIHYDVATIPTITGGSGRPYLITFDLHYQSTNMATKQKAPNFYV